MALLMTEGFDWLQPTWNTGTLLADNMTKLGWRNAAFSYPATGRFGGMAFFTDYNYPLYKTFSTSGGPSTLIIGAAMKASGRTNIALFSTSGGICIQFSLSENGSMFGYTYEDNVYNYSLGGLFPGDSWFYFEAKIVCSKTSGSYVCRVNGTQILSVSGVKTLRSGSLANIDEISLGYNTNSGSGTFDDVYICDTAPGGPSDFLGPVRVQTLFPTANGDNIQFTPSNPVYENWLMASDPSISGATYVYGSNGTSGYYDLYQGGDVLAVNSVYGVRPVTVAAQTDVAPVINYTTAIKTNGSTFFGSSPKPGGSNYIWADSVYGLNPATSSSWTASDVNNLQFGPKQG